MKRSPSLKNKFNISKTKIRKWRMRWDTAAKQVAARRLSDSKCEKITKLSKGFPLKTNNWEGGQTRQTSILIWKRRKDRGRLVKHKTKQNKFKDKTKQLLTQSKIWRKETNFWTSSYRMPKMKLKGNALATSIKILWLIKWKTLRREIRS